MNEKSHEELVRDRDSARHELYGLEFDLRNLDERVFIAEIRLDLARFMVDWLSKTPTLDVNVHTRFHKLLEGFEGFGHVVCLQAESDEPLIPVAELIRDDQHIFVVKHNWAAAFKGDISADVSEQWRLPYDHCVFEFMISGTPVIVFATDNSTGTPLFKAACIGVHHRWLMLDMAHYPDTPHLIFAWAQVKAICIALDAEVAVTEVERAPLKLN